MLLGYGSKTFRKPFHSRYRHKQAVDYHG